MSPTKLRYTTASLLLCAGLAVTAGNYCGSGEWGNYIPVGLGFVLAAIVLSVVAIARSAKEAVVGAPVESGVRKRWLILGAAILIHGAAAIYLCRTLPANTMDCYTFQRDATRNLVHGVDPYGATQANIYSPAESAMYYGPNMVVNGRVQVGYMYPPLTLLWILPGYFLGDVRYSYVFAIMIAGLLSFAMVPSRRSLWLAVFLLLNPITFYVENRCFIEPLVLMMLCATLYAAVKRRWWLPIALGLFLASKQYNLLALPFVGYLAVPFEWKRYLKLAGWSLAVAAATVLPFALWNVHALWRDTIHYLLTLPARNDALSFAVPLPFVMKVGPVLLLAFIAWSAWVARRSAAMFAVGYGIALLLIFSTGKQAFCNYYFLMAQALFLAVAAWPGYCERAK